MKTRNTIDIGWDLSNSYLELPEIFYSKVKPSPVSSGKLVILNESLARSLGLNIEGLKSKEGIDHLSGNKVPEASIPLGQAYGGHQFGHFTMLGDGRAMLLGEQKDEFNNKFDIQLKGSGKTPYSRRGDGRGAIGPMLREYIISEAMDSLGIPTTRSLAIVATGDKVQRERALPGAILTRVASSHLRVGTFEYAATWGSTEDIKKLADYSIRRHFPKIVNNKNPYLALLKEVIKNQTQTIGKWQLVGFIHGVMNTDNMTISGETIDYGPCAFMDIYDSKTVFSSIDHKGRYAYGNQPKIAQWNLARFAETLLPLIHKDQEEAIKLAEIEIKNFENLYYINWLKGMKAKLGIIKEEPGDKDLVEDLLTIMEKYKADYTNTFLGLTFNKLKGIEMFQSEEFLDWQNKWEDRLSRENVEKEIIQKRMKNNNPAVIPRNYLVEEALEVAQNKGDYNLVKEIVQILSDPYNHSKSYGKYGEIPKSPSTPYKTFCGT